MKPQPTPNDRLGAARRKANARAALSLHVARVCNQTEDATVRLTDLLTDLMHLHGRDFFDNAARIAREHHQAEA